MLREMRCLVRVFLRSKVYLTNLKEENYEKKERLSRRQEGRLSLHRALYRTEGPRPGNKQPEQWGGPASLLTLVSHWLTNEGKNNTSHNSPCL